MRASVKTTIFAIFSWIFLLMSDSWARFSLIRDAQSEKFLYELCSPVLVAAGLNPSEVDLYIVNDQSINAFVSGGQNIFINTGLIRKYKTPNALIGVVAHEAGHITASHIARSSEEIKRATSTILLSYLLGIGAVIAGSPEAGQGIIMGGDNIAQKLYLKFSRSQEEAADRHALKYLEKIQYPADGLVKLLEFFESQSRGYKGQIDEYAMSHPISKKRIDYLKHNVKHVFFDKSLNQKLQPQMDRILFKLEAFIEPPNNVLKKYQNDNSTNANYAKSIAFYRIGEVQRSLKILDKIIQNNKNDGFLHELKGQILYESGRVKPAILSYKKAIQLIEEKYSSQARIYFANAILSTKTRDKELLKIAISNLKKAQIFEKENPFLYKNFANAYNANGDEARSFAALAEYNFLIGDKKKAKKYIKIAKEKFNKEKFISKVELLRLDDLAQIIADSKK